MRARLAFGVAFGLYAAALFTATHWPGLRVDGPVPHTDKWVHFAAFAVWTLLLIAAKPFAGSTRKRIVVCGLIAAVYSLIDELLQGIPGLNRFVSWQDMLANLGGVAIGMALAFAATAATGRRTSTDAASPGSAGTLGSDVRTVSGMTLISRMLGLVRDVTTARIFGDTAVGSAFAAAMAIPNVFRRLFGEGAISAAFIPAYSRLKSTDKPAADALASLTIGAVALVTSVITVAGELVLLAIVLGSPDDPERAESLRLIMVTLPFMPLICVAAILGGVLQTHGRFGPWAAAPIILNVCMLSAAVPFFFVESATAGRWAVLIGIAVVVSGMVQVAWSLLALRGTVVWTGTFAPAIAEGREMLGRLVPALVGLGTIQLNTLLDTAIAMWPSWVGPTIAGRAYPLDTASNGILFYAQRLYQFPLGVFGIAVATVIFPALSKQAGDANDFLATLRRGLRLSLFIGLPASVGLALVGQDLTAVVLRGFGENTSGLSSPGFSASGFSVAGADRAAVVLFAYSLAVWAYGLNQVAVRAFYALGDTRTPMRVSLIAVAVNLSLNLVLIWPLREAGLAAATAASACAQLAVLTVLLRRRVAAGHLLDPAGWRSIGLTAGGSCVVGVLVAMVLLLWPSAESWTPAALRLAASVVIGGLGYLIWAWITRAQELRWLLSRNAAS